MSVYYQDDTVTLYHGDCLADHREWLGADVLVTDPPYGIAWKQGKHKGKGNQGIANDLDTKMRDSVIEAWGEGRPGIAFGSPLIAPPAGSKQVLVYHKPPDSGLFGSRAGFRRDWESVYLFGAWPQEKPRRSSVIKTSAPSLISIVAKRYPNDKGAGHPHAKPLDVMRELLSACPEGVVADPFAGAGATLIAAKAMGRKAIGVELEEKYCELIATRLSQEVLDL